MGQAHGTLDFFKTLQHRPLDQLFSEKFSLTLKQLCAFAPKERHPLLKLELFKIAISKQPQNFKLIAEAGAYVHETAALVEKDPSQYVLCKQLLETFVARVKLP